MIPLLKIVCEVTRVMNTIVLFATKHGAAQEIANRIANRMDGAIAHDLKQSNTPDIADFDCVVVGSSVYAGAIRKEAKAFLSQNANTLKNKKIGLFLSGMSSGEMQKAFTENVPDDVLQSAKVKASLGGVFDPNKAGFMERVIMRIVTKQSGFVSTIDDKKIDEFVRGMDS